MLAFSQTVLKWWSVKKFGNECITFTNFMIHQEPGWPKNIAKLDVVLPDIVEVVNFIKSHVLNCGLFPNLCTDMGSEYKYLLIHADVRWLWRSHSSKRLLKLKDEVLLFLTEQKSDFANLSHNKLLPQNLCYSSDIFEKLNFFHLKN